MLRRLHAPLLAALGLCTVASGAMAQDIGPHRHFKGRQARAAEVTPGSPATFRGLTINRPPQDALPPEDDIYRDGPIRYNDVRDYSPSPYTTSGVQYPFGLDGVGGFGSDLGLGAGQDTALYDRGANSRP